MRCQSQPRHARLLCVCVLDLNSDIMIVTPTVPLEPELSCIIKKCSHFIRDVLYCTYESYGSDHLFLIKVTLFTNAYCSCPHPPHTLAHVQMRATVAPCIEAVIVLDRLLFLRESVSFTTNDTPATCNKLIKISCAWPPINN